MRTLQDSRQRWREFFATYDSKASLKQAILRKQHISSPGDVGLRSLCWKLFLYLPDFAPSTWSGVLTSSRDVFTTLRAKLLGPLESGNIDVNEEDPDHPIDPLAEDPSNPWSQLRKDEELRREILQDVERCMPDHDYFRSEKVQKQMLDILFVYCKLNDDIGYRQGMHEIVATLLWVVDNDALQADASELSGDEIYMLEALHLDYVEHDTFSLFQAVMHSARPWYELGEDSDAAGRKGNSPIVEKSRVIHEELLMAVDPQLAIHLKELEILPQVFLIRWIRLLFEREFPFEQLLVLWDSLFAEDPDFTLVDYICVAMLLRIRWQLLEFDYSMVLTLLLRYPEPKPPNLPATFVSDAIYLRNNLTPDGGAYIVSKYSNRAPAPVTIASPPQSPTGSPSRRMRMTNSPLRRAISPIAGQTSRMIQAHGGLDRLVNDLAKGVVDRGKEWGLSKPIERFMEEFQRNKPPENGDRVPPPVNPETAREIRRRKKAALQERNEILKEALERSYQELSKAVGDRPELQDALNRIRLVELCLQDSDIKVDRDFFKDSSQSKEPQDEAATKDATTDAQIQAPPEIPLPPTLSPQEPNPQTASSPMKVFPQNPSPLPPLPQSPLPPLPQTNPSAPATPTIAQSQEEQSPRSPAFPFPAPPPLPPPPKHGKRTLVGGSSSRSQPATRRTSSSTSSPTTSSFPTTAFSSNPGTEHISTAHTHRARSSLAQSGFAWMLGEDPLEVRSKVAFGGNGNAGGGDGGLFGAKSEVGSGGGGEGGLFGDGGGSEEGLSGRGGSGGSTRGDNQRAMLFGV